MHYYAFYNSCGVNTRHASDNQRVGRLHIFDTRRERDAWVDDEHYEDGDVHREAITCKEALGIMQRFAYAMGLFDPVFDCPTTDDLVAVYRDFSDEA